MFPMRNFERAGTETTGPVFGVGLCACSMFALPITMLSSAITRRVCFIIVFSWEGAHSPPSLIQTPPAALSFRQTLAQEPRLRHTGGKPKQAKKSTLAFMLQFRTKKRESAAPPVTGKEPARTKEPHRRA